ncbi:hypothetical protein K504DRAFT_465034 [Pleomassaria siparia CBS 279.74]|uniref:gamma-glutamylcyclotransferase n=1 Tax=Pleomassaria siparia CBS 279.74 TaxID=1314801 RepID=A0A6G1KEL0_9PLEO|nr:hypothetical protein K504DRAFT_465034 [Pleomassaria siparia CBS 279.74]
MEFPPSRWYFAYGSNLCSSVFLQSRGIRSLDSKIVRIDKLRLCFNVLFLPYSEPAMAGLQSRTEEDCMLYMPVHGVAYLLRDQDFVKLVISEGAGVAYKVIQVNAVVLTSGTNLMVTTLVARRDYAFQQDRYPSQRYMNLIKRGAREQHLPQMYTEYLQRLPVFKPRDSGRWKAGRWLFHRLWRPVTWVVEKGTRKLKHDRGHVPGCWLLIFDLLLCFMWIQHDAFFSPIFGRGDGRS